MWLLFGGYLDQKDKKLVIITKKMKELVWMLITIQNFTKKFENNISFLFVKINFNLNTFYWYTTYIFTFSSAQSHGFTQ